MEKTATKIKDLTTFRGWAALYKLSTPVVYGFDWEQEVPLGRTEYVVVSAVTAPYSGPETYIFASDSSAKILNWGELDGSFRGGLDHRRALEGAGFGLIEQQGVHNDGSR